MITDGPLTRVFGPSEPSKLRSCCVTLTWYKSLTTRRGLARLSSVISLVVIAKETIFSQ